METTVRAGVLVLDVVVLLFALGWVVGASLLQAVGESFASFGVCGSSSSLLPLSVAATRSWHTVN